MDPTTMGHSADGLIYILCIIPPMLLAMFAQGLVQARYRAGLKRRSSMTGAQAARMILDSAGLQDVPIEPIRGTLTDHYDPRAKVLRLSEDVYYQPTLASVGIAAHEAGHAIQDAVSYSPLVIRNIAVPLANIGSQAGIWLTILGFFLNMFGLILLGIVLFSGTVFFQLINLPVEFNASSRAKEQLVRLGIVNSDEINCVRGVLSAAALTYVAATLVSIMQLIYFILRALSSRRQ